MLAIRKEQVKCFFFCQRNQNLMTKLNVSLHFQQSFHLTMRQTLLKWLLLPLANQIKCKLIHSGIFNIIACIHQYTLKTHRKAAIYCMLFKIQSKFQYWIIHSNWNHLLKKYFEFEMWLIWLEKETKKKTKKQKIIKLKLTKKIEIVEKIQKFVKKNW